MSENTAPKQRPTNPIIGQARAAEWDKKMGNIEGVVTDVLGKLDAVTGRKTSAGTWVAVALQIVILVKQFWG